MMGSTVTLQPIIAPDDATVKNLTWVSSDEQTATVSRTGIVTALSVGETTITATTVDGGYSAEIKIIVTAAAQLGDVNGDGYIDAADALLCLARLRGSHYAHAGAGSRCGRQPRRSDRRGRRDPDPALRCKTHPEPQLTGAAP